MMLYKIKSAGEKDIKFLYDFESDTHNIMVCESRSMVRYNIKGLKIKGKLDKTNTYYSKRGNNVVISHKPDNKGVYQLLVNEHSTIDGLDDYLLELIKPAFDMLNTRTLSDLIGLKEKMSNHKNPQ